MKKSTPRFSKNTLAFIVKASKQTRPEWLEKNFSEYEEHLLFPLKNLAAYLQTKLAASASGYRFPQKGIGRIKRSANRAKEWGLFKDWVNYSASRPATSRFESNPNLYFEIDPTDKDGDQVIVAGGLYVPSSQQTRAIRHAIAQDASEFEKLFASKAFKSRFKGGFSKDRISTRNPRGFDPNHPKMEWLKLQGFFVWRAYSMKEFTSVDFPKLIAEDFKQILKLNALLEKAIRGTKIKPERAIEKKSATTPTKAGIVAPSPENWDF